MENEKNKEMLERIKRVIEEYDEKGITVDSFLIGGRKTEYFVEKELKLPSSESIYCSSYIDSESIKHSQPIILSTKAQLYKEVIDTLINKALGKDDNEIIKSTTFLRTTGFHINELLKE